METLYIQGVRLFTDGYAMPRKVKAYRITMRVSLDLTALTWADAIIYSYELMTLILNANTPKTRRPSGEKIDARLDAYEASNPEAASAVEVKPYTIVSYWSNLTHLI